jgi:hypothetical protein
MKITFLTFGATTDDYHNAANRICRQAENFDLFDNIINLTEKDLEDDDEFWPKHKDFINSNPRGYGYWLWKPYIIKKTLESMNDGDILLYADCGCELNSGGKRRLLELIELTKQQNIIGTSAASTDISYTKMDLIKHLEMDGNVDLLQISQIAATTLMMIKNDLIMNFIDEYYSVCANNYNLIDDTPSIENNFCGFIENRHDQSVFSLLAKKYKLINYSLDPTYWGCGFESRQFYLQSATEYPIWTCRNRTGNSIMNYTFSHLKHPL